MGDPIVIHPAAAAPVALTIVEGQRPMGDPIVTHPAAAAPVALTIVEGQRPMDDPIVIHPAAAAPVALTMQGISGIREMVRNFTAQRLSRICNK